MISANVLGFHSEKLLSSHTKSAVFKTVYRPYECDVVQSGWRAPTFRRNILPPSSMCKMPLTRDISQYCNITLITAVLAFQRSLRKEL